MKKEGPYSKKWQNAFNDLISKDPEF